jgi:carbon monoxide dehydrogenase subunit G
MTDHRDPRHRGSLFLEPGRESGRIFRFFDHPLAKEASMGKLMGNSTAEIDAPIEEVWALVEDVEKAPDWQGGLKGLRAVERDDDGHATLCESESDGKVRTIKSTVRFTYDAPTTLTWVQEKGELKSVDGRWELEDLGGDRTRATYDLEVDLGRMLGMVIRGPLVDLLRGMLVNARAEELKQAMEAG